MAAQGERGEAVPRGPGGEGGGGGGVNVFANDGSFLELFKRRMEAEQRGRAAPDTAGPGAEAGAGSGAEQPPQQQQQHQQQQPPAAADGRKKSGGALGFVRPRSPPPPAPDTAAAPPFPHLPGPSRPQNSWLLPYLLLTPLLLLPSGLCPFPPSLTSLSSCPSFFCLFAPASFSSVSSQHLFLPLLLPPSLCLQCLCLPLFCSALLFPLPVPADRLPRPALPAFIWCPSSWRGGRPRAGARPIALCLAAFHRASAQLLPPLCGRKAQQLPHPGGWPAARGQQAGPEDGSGSKETKDGGGGPDE